MRRVTDPTGAAWTVDVSWTDVRFGTQFKRKREARAERRRARAQAKARGEPVKSRGSWLDGLDVVPFDLEGVVAVAVVVAVVILAVLLFPWLAVLLLDAAELLAFPLIAIVIIGWRASRRRPFTITAEREHEQVAEWRVVGVRVARRVERALADAIVAGGTVTELFPENAPPFRGT
jgi:hypothetical protein